MFKKVKEYFKGKNPYLMASAAIVIVSMAVICWILKEEMSTVQETAVSDVVIEEQGYEFPEESVQESETLSQVSDSKPESVIETQIVTKESVQSTPEPQNTPEPEKITITETTATPAPEVLPEPEEMVSTEVVPDTQPEEEIPKEPETTPEPEVIPELEVPHEHSWMFESVFQEPTCSNGGLENQICAHCGETRTVGGTPTGAHNYVVENTGDCCSEEVVRCSECNTREVREKDMNNHIDVEDGICYGCGQKVASE